MRPSGVRFLQSANKAMMQAKAKAVAQERAGTVAGSNAAADPDTKKGPGKKEPTQSMRSSKRQGKAQGTATSATNDKNTLTGVGTVSTPEGGN